MMEPCGSRSVHTAHHYVATDSNGYLCEGSAVTEPDDRATQISARLAAATWRSGSYQDYDDLAWLLAERVELLRRVEAAERAGAVKALRGASEDWPMIGNLAVKEWLSFHADDIENGADL